MSPRRLKIAFIHPDLGIGGAERLIVDAALGLQKLGHSVDVYTSHHNPSHCFEETRDGTLNVRYLKPPFPRSFKGKFHIFLAHARQLHLTNYLLSCAAPKYDIYFVDQLSTCIPFLRAFGKTRVLFYCHFPDKLLANGALVEGQLRAKLPLLKRLYRLPMDWLEETTTGQADTILANSKFTARVFRAQFPSINVDPKVVYPGINFDMYRSMLDENDANVVQVKSTRPTLVSLNRFEKKKNAALAIHSFALLRQKSAASSVKSMRLVIAGGYDPRVEDNMMTLASLIDVSKSHALTYNIVAPGSSHVAIPPFSTTKVEPDILFLLNFTTAQRTALLTANSTLILLYTPENEHFGIGPVEGMFCGLPVLACNSGGPTESVVDAEVDRTGWLRPPQPNLWADVLESVVVMNTEQRAALAERSKKRAREYFGMEAMAKGLEDALVESAALGPVQVSNWYFATVFMFALGLLLQAYIFYGVIFKFFA